MTLTRDVPLVPSQSALLFVDVQNFSAHRDGGEFTGLTEQEFQDKHGWLFEQLDHIIPRMQALHSNLT